MSNKIDQKINVKMRKKGSPHLVRIVSDPADNHFCNVEMRKISTGEVRGQHYILKSDLSTWISMFNRDGFKCVEL
mgnify:CR=1 FL=1